MSDTTDQVKCISLTQSNILSFEQYIPQDQMQHIAEDDWYGLGVVKDNIACGAAMLWYISKEKTAVLPYFMIDERMRGQGLGKILYNAVEELAVSIGANKLETRIFMPEQAEAQTLLIREGFENFTDEQWVLEVTGKLLMEYLSDEDASGRLKAASNKYSDKIVPLKKLTQSQKNEINASGMDDDLSFAIISGQKAGGSILVNRTEDGKPMITDFAVEPEFAPVSLALIAKCLLYIAKDIKKDGIFYIRAGRKKERDLLIELAGDYFSQAVLNYTCHSVKQIAEDDILREFTVSDEDFLLIRAQSVADMLAEEDYEVYFSSEDGGAISVSKPGTMLPELLMFYEWDGDEEHMAYRLVALSNLPDMGGGVFPSELIAQSCAMVNISESDGKIVARAALAEYGGISDIDTIRSFIEEFWREIIPFAAEEPGEEE